MTAITRLLDIMARLRDPEHGCPWDRKQTYATIIPFTIEEVYEVVDAVERGDLQDLREELGDLLFQVVFLARIAEEEGQFDFEAVAQTISDKLIRRHPHVIFGRCRFRRVLGRLLVAATGRQACRDRDMLAVISAEADGLYCGI